MTGAVVTGCSTTSGLSETTGSLRISHVEVFTGSIANISLGSVRRAVGTCKKLKIINIGRGGRTWEQVL